MQCEPKSRFGNCSQITANSSAANPKDSACLELHGLEAGLGLAPGDGFCHARRAPVTSVRCQKLHKAPLQRGWVALRQWAWVALLPWGIACGDWSHFAAGSNSRCAEGLVVTQARCCAPGQAVSQGHCVGRPSRCPTGWEALESPVAGCARVSHPVLIQPGRYLIGPNDWESEHVVAGEGNVEAFWLDATEVTLAGWARCVGAGACAPAKLRERLAEPGLPMVGITAVEAESFCNWAKGRLPRSEEWLRVAVGPNSRRFPWGQTGLVCRRASFGLVRGPCAEGGVSPDWVGSRPDGKSEAGLYDLVGNVAEIVKTAQGDFELRGGSFRSDHAASLKTWSSVPYMGPGPDVGFRCAYDSDPEASPR
jgi:formylglycine-generating enzyme